MKEALIYNYASKNNLIAGICRADPIKAQNTDAPFVTKNKEMRLNPGLFLPQARSVIVLGLGYNKKDAFTLDNKPRGEISKGAAGRDYHVLLKEELLKLAGLLGLSRYKIFVDTGPLMERDLAYRAGLGFFGKNNLLINEKLGSFFNIGLILTDLELSPSSPIKKSCAGCGNCFKSCPGGALKGTGFDYRLCVSYLTQKKEAPTEKEQKIMGRAIYGCDICQEACPHNGHFVGEITNIEERFPLLLSFIELSPLEFKEKYGQSAMYWRGQKILVRNAQIALLNSK